MNLTQSLAFYGAILSTILATIEVIKLNRDKASIKVTVKGGYKIYPPNTVYGDKEYILISVSNRGRRVSTITHVALLMPNGKYMLATDSFTKGQREVKEGKSADYLLDEKGIQEKERLNSKDYIAVVNDATGRKYYSHFILVRWVKIILMKLKSKTLRR